MAEAEPPLSVEVCYALPQRQWICLLRLPAGSTVGDAIAASGLAETMPALQVDDGMVGIFSRPASLASALRDGDRVEIYRPLQIDPKDARRKRADESRPKRR